MSQDNKPATTARLLSLILTSELEALGNFLEGTEAPPGIEGHQENRDSHQIGLGHLHEKHAFFRRP